MVGGMKLKKLGAMQAQGLYRSMLDRGLSARTVRYTHAILRRGLKQAVRWGMVNRNVCEDVDQPQLKGVEMRPLGCDQTRRLLQAASEAGDRLEALYVLAVHIGMRPGELLALKWQDVD
jgi:integrase